MVTSVIGTCVDYKALCPFSYMPRGLILILLLLLIGTYFFLSGGSSTQVKLPSLDVQVDAAPSSKGYLVTVTGAIRLPEEEEYEVNGVSITFYGDAERVDEKTLSGGTIKGPGEYPISASATLPSSVTSGKIVVKSYVIHGGQVDEISTTIPVVLPSESMRVKSPRIFVSVSSLTPLDGNVNVALSVVFTNPNNADMSISDAKVTLNGQERALSVSSVAKGESTSATASYVLPNTAKAYDVRVAGKFTVSGITQEFSYTGSIYIPSVPLAKPYASISATPVSASGSGIKFTLSGTIFNPNPSAVVVDRVYVKVLGGSNIIQEFNWMENNTIAPEGNLSLPSKTITVDEDMHNAKIEVHLVHNGSDDVVAKFPLFTVDISDMLEAPKINATLSYDSNTAQCTITVSITNPNDIAIDVNNLRIYFDQAGNDDENVFSVFSVSPDSTETRSFTPNLVVSPTVDSTVLVSGVYGISTLNVWIPFEYKVIGKCA